MLCYVVYCCLFIILCYFVVLLLFFFYNLYFIFSLFSVLISILLFNLFILFFVFSILFFLSSRRRHTICLSDWSSDVCSSDLTSTALRFHFGEQLLIGDRIVIPTDSDPTGHVYSFDSTSGDLAWKVAFNHGVGASPLFIEIGRASCRERVLI